MRIRIDNLEDLEAVVKTRGSVVVPGTVAWGKPTPAAFMINQNGRYLLSLFKGGMYLYKRRIKIEQL